MSECQEYLPQLFNQDLIFTFLLLASQPHTNLLFTSQSHFIFIPSTARVKRHPEWAPPRVRKSPTLAVPLGRRRDWTEPTGGGTGVSSLNQRNHVPTMVPGTLGMTGCKHSPEMPALKPASLAGTLMPLTARAPLCRVLIRTIAHALKNPVMQLPSPVCT